MGGILDGIKWGVILQLGVVVILPAVMPMLGNLGGTLGNLTGGGGQQGGQMGQQHSGRPYGYNGDYW